MLGLLFLGFAGLVMMGVACSGVTAAIKSTKPNPHHDTKREAASKAWAVECEARRRVQNQCAERIASLAGEL